MSDKFQEVLEIPKNYIRDGNQVCHCLLFPTCAAYTGPHKPSSSSGAQSHHRKVLNLRTPVCRELRLSPEFAGLCKAVAIGFAVMGFIGYFVKLIHIPM